VSIRYLTVAEVTRIHAQVVATSGGARGLRDPGALASAVGQPAVTFGGEELYPDLLSKAACLGFGLVANHPFEDGNKRIGHAAMEVMLMIHGFEIQADVDDQEATILAVADGRMQREAFDEWLRARVHPLAKP